MDEQLHEVSVKVNNLRADTNAPNTSISENKAKKMGDDLEALHERVGENEKVV